MSLTNFPKKTKYAYLDEVFALINGVITPLVVAGWRVVVDDPDGDDTGRQRTFYNFSTISTEIVEEKVYASENHLLSMLKGDYFNIDFALGVGESGLFKNHNNHNDGLTVPSFGNWVDFGGFSFEDVNFILPSVEKRFPTTVSGTSGSAIITGTGSGSTGFDLFVSRNPGDNIKIGSETKAIDNVDSDTQITLTTTLASNHTNEIATIVKVAAEIQLKYYDLDVSDKTLIFDNANLEGATLPVSIDTKAEFKDKVKSYDKDTTIWTDGNPIGE